MTAYNATGNKYYTLAFIISQGTCNATINGDTTITDSGWNSAINSLRAVGGDVIASFGGASGTEIGRPARRCRRCRRSTSGSSTS